MRKGLRQAKKEKNYEKALQFNAALASEGKAYGMTGSADDTASIAQGRVNARDALSNQMRGQLPAMAGQTREGNIAAAKAAGTFDATRQKYNQANSGKKVMDEAGNIMDAPTTPVPSPTPTPTPAASTNTPPANPTQPKPPAKVASAKPSGRIMDNGVDVSSDIRKGLSGSRTGGFYTEGTGTPAPAPTQPKPVTPAAEVNPAPAAPDTSAVRESAAKELFKKPAGAENKAPENRISKLVQDVKAGRGDSANTPQLPSSAFPQLPPLDIPAPIPKADTDKLRAEVNAAFTPPVQKAVQGVGRVAKDVANAAGTAMLAGAQNLAEATGLAVPRKDKEKFSQTVAARAKGGPVKAGKPYLVGEEGPEIVVPDEDGEVLPNEKLRKKSRKELQKMLSKR
jgi:hypothetical protein